MHIFNINQKPNLIITESELLFRDRPTDETMNRHQLQEIKSISVEHRYNADKELHVWLKVQMNTDKTPHLIQLSSLDTPLDEVLQTLEKELKNKVKLFFPKPAWLEEVKTHHKRKKQILMAISLLIIALFTFHKLYTPSLNALADNALKKQFKKNSGLCSVEAKAAYKNSTEDLLTIKSYCGIFGLWQEVASKKIPAQYLETEFSSLSLKDYTKIIQESIKTGDYSSARKNIDTILYLDPKNANAHLLLGIINYESGFKEKAFKEMKKAVKLDSTSSSILNSVTFYYIKDKQYPEALTYANIAVTLNNSAKELQALATIESKLGKDKEAIQHFEQSLYEDTNNTAIYTKLGLLYWKNSAYEKAADVFQKAYYLEPNKVTTFLNYYEISLISKPSLSTQEIEKFEKDFQENKDVFITYDMLRILKLSLKGEEIMPSLQRWDSSYSGTKLNWSFEEILLWLDNSPMEQEKKYSIKKAIGFFIAYQQIYRLEHSKEKVL